MKNKPPLEDDCAKHKRKAEKKRFGIERRYVGAELKLFGRDLYESFRVWHVYKRYETESSMERALKDHNNKGRNASRLKWEFRKEENETS